MDLEEVSINAGNWVDLAQDKYYWRTLVKAALNARVSLAMELVKVLSQSSCFGRWIFMTSST